MAQEFKDHFSKQAELYLKYRPHYPDALYDCLAQQCTNHELALDCGTGNGQAALGLAPLFAQVIATDPSEQQLNLAIPHDKIKYLAATAEALPLPNNSVDLLTVANALHWFNLDLFYAEAHRVLKPGAVIAAWCYGTPLHGSAIDEVVAYLHNTILDDYWLAENRLVERQYRTLPFPFKELDTPHFKIEKPLDFNDLVGLLNTWSAVQRYKDRHGTNPVSQIEDQLLSLWGDKDEPKLFTWELSLRLGRND